MGKSLLSLMFSVRITSENKVKPGIWSWLEAEGFDFSQAVQCTPPTEPSFFSEVSKLYLERGHTASKTYGFGLITSLKHLRELICISK